MIRGYAIVDESPSGLSVGYEDLDVEAFGGMDYEATYTLDVPNREKLRSALAAAGHEGPIEAMIREHFGDCLENESFAVYCDGHGIRYELFTWIS